MKFELQTLEEYSDEALLSELRRVTEELNGERLTRKRFSLLARVHPSTLEKRFGNWRLALDKAGISETIAPRNKVLTREMVTQALEKFIAENPGKSVTEQYIAKSLGFYRGAIIRQFGKWETLLAETGLTPVPYGRRYTEEECFENILQLWTHYGRQPHFEELKHPPSTVKPKAYIHRWGGWRAALSAFVKKINEPSLLVTDLRPQNEPTLARETADTMQIVPRSISLGLRYKILSRDNFRCVICGASPAKDVGVDLHIDHIYPWSRGGQSIEENLRTLCAKCNLGKSDKVEQVDKSQ